MAFLEPHGHLVAVMSAGVEFRSTKRSTAFRALMKHINATLEDLPIGSFSEQGTNVSTCIVRVYKDGRKNHGSWQHRCAWDGGVGEP